MTAIVAMTNRDRYLDNEITKDEYNRMINR